MNHAALSEPGDLITTVAAGVTITLTKLRDGYSRTVFAGPHRVAELGATHADEALARAQCSHIRAALLAGVRVDQIALEHVANGQTVVAVAEEVLVEALRVATADPDTIAAEPTVAALQGLLPADDAGDDVLVARINAHLDEVHAVDRCPKHPQWIMPCPVCLFEATPTNIGQTVQSGQNRPVRITRTHVFAQPLTGPQQTAIDGHRNGTVRLGNGVTRPMLRAIEDKGYGACVKGGLGRRPYEIELLVLNQAGRKLAGIGDAP